MIPLGISPDFLIIIYGVADRRDRIALLNFYGGKLFYNNFIVRAELAQFRRSHCSGGGFWVTDFVVGVETLFKVISIVNSGRFSR